MQNNISSTYIWSQLPTKLPSKRKSKKVTHWIKQYTKLTIFKSTTTPFFSIHTKSQNVTTAENDASPTMRYTALRGLKNIRNITKTSIQSSWILQLGIRLSHDLKNICNISKTFVQFSWIFQFDICLPLDLSFYLKHHQHENPCWKYDHQHDYHNQCTH